MGYYNQLCLRVKKSKGELHHSKIKELLVKDGFINKKEEPQSGSFQCLKYLEWNTDFKSYFSETEIVTYLENNLEEEEYGLIRVGEEIGDYETRGEYEDFGLGVKWEIYRECDRVDSGAERGGSMYSQAALILLNLPDQSPKIAVFQLESNVSTNKVQWWKYRSQSFSLEKEENIECKLNECYIIDRIIFDAEQESEASLWKRVKSAFENALLYDSKIQKYQVSNLLS